LPKSARKILLVLPNFNFVTQKEIQSLTGLSIRSVKSSLIILKKRNLIEELNDFSDMRCKIYRLGGEFK